MSYKYNWYQEDVALELVFDGDVNINDLKALNNDLMQYYELAQKPLILIVDATKAGKVPNNLFEVNSITRDIMNHDNSGPVIMIGFKSNPILNFLTTTVAQILKKSFVNINDRDELDATVAKFIGVN